MIGQKRYTLLTNRKMPGYNLEFRWSNGYTLNFNIHEWFYDHVVKPEIDKMDIADQENDDYIHGPGVRVLWDQCRGAGYTIGSRDFGFPESFYLWRIGETNTFFI